mmetsp:Transcript_12392/g.35201  ORF Transcript_12392/g.35201 Transcript_12392/m.35201 type:complete len:224 (-) Transcript_12392:499-1170(-)
MKSSMSPPSHNSVTKYTKRWSSNTSKSLKVFWWSMSSIMRTSRLKSAVSPICDFRIFFTARTMACSPLCFNVAFRTSPKVPLPILEAHKEYLSSSCAVSFEERWSQTIWGKQAAPNEPGPVRESATQDHCERVRRSELLTSARSGAARCEVAGCSVKGRLRRGPGALGSNRICGGSAVRPTLLSTIVAVPGSPRSRSAVISPADRLGPSSQRGSALLLQIMYL